MSNMTHPLTGIIPKIPMHTIVIPTAPELMHGGRD